MPVAIGGKILSVLEGSQIQKVKSQKCIVLIQKTWPTRCSIFLCVDISVAASSLLPLKKGMESDNRTKLVPKAITERKLFPTPHFPF
ncbi:hypothetical protein GDO86_019349 [Hymenochirus boettgeri]|uniref:Uncharacterized protein n=1 Tax=Hymenochirus boettgeri TaxID=247094 RepID=A0A8T2IF06_9PIPI|nr:hypothetical protein GDO86_019349 [Hymenochirus boettgeri]